MTIPPKYTVQPLGKQNRAAFHCGDKELDSYFLERSSREVPVEELPESLQKKTGKDKRVGVTLLGRLAISQDQQGKRLGEFLLLHALRKASEGAKTVASFAVVVDAKGEHVVKFYTKYGFTQLSANRYILPMKAIRQLFPDPE